MDGLTISKSQQFLNTGKTASELNSLEMKGSSGSTGKGENFADTLKNAINEVNRLQKDADVKMQKLATGESNNIPEVMIAAERADIALKLMVQVRNKVIDAYNEVMKMQV